MDTREKNQEMQTIDSTDIFVRNAKGVLRVCMEDGSGITGNNWFGGLYWFFELLLLPINMTISAGIQTAIDVSARRPLLLNTVNEIVQALSTFDYESINTITAAINGYECGSHSCSELKESLKKIDTDLNDTLENFKKTKLQEFLAPAQKTKHEEIQKGMKQLSKKNNVIFFNLDYQPMETLTLTSSCKQAFEDCIQKQMEVLSQEAKVNKIRLISNYLQASHNAGKDLQHFIVKVVVLAPTIKILKNLDENDLNKLSAYICDLEEDSSHYQKLKKNLEEINKNTHTLINNLALEKENELKINAQKKQQESLKKTITEMVEKVGIIVDKPIGCKKSYALSQTDHAEIRNYVLQLQPEILRKAKNEQIELISNYLLLPEDSETNTQELIITSIGKLEFSDELSAARSFGC